MGKVLYIRDCYFKLPEDFNGTCGNALMLLGLHRLEQEKQQSVRNENQNENRLNNFWESSNKCTMAYCIDTEEKIRNMEGNSMNRTVDVFSNVDVDKLKNEIKEDMKNLSDKLDTDNNTSTNENIGNCQVDLMGNLKINRSNKCNNFNIDLVAGLKKKETKSKITECLTGLFSKKENK